MTRRTSPLLLLLSRPQVRRSSVRPFPDFLLTPYRISAGSNQSQGLRLGQVPVKKTTWEPIQLPNGQWK